MVLATVVQSSRFRSSRCAPFGKSTRRCGGKNEGRGIVRYIASGEVVIKSELCMVSTWEVLELVVCSILVYYVSYLAVHLCTTLCASDIIHFCSFPLSQSSEIVGLLPAEELAIRKALRESLRTAAAERYEEDSSSSRSPSCSSLRCPTDSDSSAVISEGGSLKLVLSTSSSSSPSSSRHSTPKLHVSDIHISSAKNSPKRALKGSPKTRKSLPAQPSTPNGRKFKPLKDGSGSKSTQKKKRKNELDLGKSVSGGSPKAKKQKLVKKVLDVGATHDQDKESLPKGKESSNKMRKKGYKKKSIDTSKQSSSLMHASCPATQDNGAMAVERDDDDRVGPSLQTPTLVDPLVQDGDGSQEQKRSFSWYVHNVHVQAYKYLRTCAGNVCMHTCTLYIVYAIQKGQVYDLSRKSKVMYYTHVHVLAQV